MNIIPLSLETKGPTSSCGIVLLSLRSAPAQKIPGVVERMMSARTALSKRTEETADSNMDSRFLLNEFLACLGDCGVDFFFFPFSSSCYFSGFFFPHAG